MKKIKDEIKKLNIYDKIIYAVLLVLLFLACYSVYLFYIRLKTLGLSLPEMMTSFDFKGQWQITALTLKGVDPYLQIGTATPAVPSIGTVPNGWGTSPWGLLLGNLFYPGYLSLDNAIKYYVVFSIIVLIVTNVIIVRKIKKESDLLAVFLFLFLMLSIHYYRSFISGNAGMLCCCFSIIACLVCEKHPYVSGILLAFAMVKPQCAALICGALLLNRKIKPLVTASITVVVSFLAATALIKKSPIELLNEFISSDIGSGGQNCGIFDFLHKIFGVDSLLTIVVSMTFGIILTAVMIIIFNKHSENVCCSWFVYAIPCIITTFWSYSWDNDNYIVILPSVVFILIAVKSKYPLVKFAFLFGFFFEFFEDIIKKIFYIGSMKLCG